MKQIYRFKRLFASFILLLISALSWAYDFEVDGIYYNRNLDGTSVIVTYKDYDYNSYSGSIVIPATVTYSAQSYSVTSIGSYAFNQCSGLTSVTIPNSVTSIGKNAFSGCSGLTSVTIPNSVTSIGSDAFRGCTGFPIIDNIRYADAYLIEAVDKTQSTYSIKEETRFIGSSAFFGCKSLTSITIPNSVTSIGDEAFSGCSGLTSVTIPNSVTSIGYSALRGCSKLTSITIPESVTTIGGSAFSNCSGLTSVSIPNSVTSIGYEAFSGCGGLTSVTINSNTFLSTAFSAGGGVRDIFGSQVEEYIIGNDVTSIGEYAFSTCSRLYSVEIGSGVLSIGRRAFDNCPKLSDVMISNSVTTIGPEAFCYCTDLGSITIPNSVTSIGSSAFQGCSLLHTVTLGSSVANIGGGAFYNCSRLTTVHVYNSEPVAINSVVFSNRANSTLYVPKGAKSAYEAADYWKEFKEIIEVSSPVINFADDNVKAICVANWDTSGDGELDEDEAAAVTSLGEVFWNKTTITSFDELQYFTGLTCIGESAFGNCSGLTSITIPNSVTRIGMGAFNGCTSLPVINNVRYADTYLVGPVDKTQSTYSIKEGTRFIGSYAFRGCSGLTSITIPNGVMSIGEDAFYGCSSLTSVTIPDGVTSIGEYAFYGCSGLETITMPNNLICIGDAAFFDCSSLSSITIPESVTSIGESAFYGCTGLTSISVDANNLVYNSRENCNAIIKYNELIVACNNTIIPNGVTRIGDYAFAKCTEITSINIPQSVYRIGNFAFENCSGLTSITIGSGVTYIGYDAFFSCSGLESVSCLAEVVPNLDIFVFFNVPQSTATLYVPAASVDAYKAADQWKEFGNIVGIDPTAVEEVKSNKNLRAKENAPIFDLMGRRLQQKPASGYYIQGGKKFFVK